MALEQIDFHKEPHLTALSQGSAMVHRLLSADGTGAFPDFADVLLDRLNEQMKEDTEDDA